MTDGMPPGLDPDAVRLPADMTAAQRTLDDITSEYAARAPADDAPARANDDDYMEAMRLYAAGRDSLLGGNVSAAVRDLRRATQLDPASGRAWLHLGRAEYAAGRREEAVTALERAAMLGAGGAETWELLGRESLSRGDDEQAIVFLCRGRQELASGDHGARIMIHFDLAMALRQKGHVRAAREALQIAGEVVSPADVAPSLRAEVARLAQRRAESLMFLGDMSCQLAEYDEALRMYRDAIEHGLPDAAATPRVIYAALRAGRPAAAAAEIARRLESEDRFISHDLLQTIHFLSDVPAVVPRVERLLSAAGDDRLSPLALQRLMIARSALHPRKGSTELRRFVEAHPTADEAIARWLDLLPERERARHVADVLQRSPPEAGPVLARQLLLSVGSCDAILDELEGDKSDAASVLAARVLLVAGDQTSADLVATVIRDRAEPHAAFLIADLAARKGDWRTADDALFDLARRGESWPIVQVLLLLQRPTEAFEIAESTVRSSEKSATTLWVDRLHVAARAAVAARRFDVAMFWLESARSLDRHDLRAMDAMLQIVGENGPAPDEARHGELVRELLSRHAESDLVMLYRARELLSTRRPAQAEQILLRLAEMRPNDPAVLLLLHRVWTEGSPDPVRAERAERWIRERLAACPDHPDLTEMLARVVAFAGRIDEAERILRDALDRRPSVNLARALEQLLMQQPARAEEGRQLWLSRLSGPHLPIGDAIQLARHHAESGKGVEAPRVLNRHIPHRAELTPEQTAIIRELLQAAAFDIITEGGADDVRGFIDAALLTRTLDDFAAGDPRHEGPAQLAYIFAVNMFAGGREGESIEVYRLALSYNPDHAWALNNLGYTLLDRGDVAAAAPLIERAYALLPDEPNVIDSIGWLRFRQGVIEDEQAEGTIREGAVTLLARAAELDPRSATLQDHLGDALWTAGRKEEAVSAWQQAETLLEQSIEAARSAGRLADTEDVERRSAVRRKLQAALSGADPLAP